MMQCRPNPTELRSMDSYIQILCRFQKSKRKIPSPSPLSTKKSPFTPPKEDFSHPHSDCVNVKTGGIFFSNFMAFSQCLNFTSIGFLNSRTEGDMKLYVRKGFLDLKGKRLKLTPPGYGHKITLNSCLVLAFGLLDLHTTCGL